MTSLKRRKPAKMNVKAVTARRCDSHRAWVRGFECSVAGKLDACQGGMEFAHVRSGTDGGMGLKPSDAHGIALCWWHHGTQTQIGEPAFERKYDIDMKSIATELAAKSPSLRKLERELEQG